jgi:hypothetical protein
LGFVFDCAHSIIPRFAIPPFRAEKEQALAELILCELVFQPFLWRIQRIDAEEVEVDGVGAVKDYDTAFRRRCGLRYL